MLTSQLLTAVQQELHTLGILSEIVEDMLVVHDDGVNNADGRGAQYLTEHGIPFERKQCAPDCPVCKGDPLIIRIAGFSGYWEDLHKEVQNQLLARTQQRL
jgi:hypothetical protein